MIIPTTKIFLLIKHGIEFQSRLFKANYVTIVGVSMKWILWRSRAGNLGVGRIQFNLQSVFPSRRLGKLDSWSVSPRRKNSQCR